MTPRSRSSLALAGVFVALALFVVLSGVTVAAGPARATVTSMVSFLADEWQTTSADHLTALAGTPLAVAGYNAQPAAGSLRRTPSVPGASYRFFAPWTDLDTTLFVQNSGVSPAEVLVDFYDPAGAPIHTYVGSLPFRGSLDLDLASIPELPSGYTGSAVLQSDQPLAAVASVHPPASDSLLSYNVAASGDTTVILPAIMREFHNWNSSFWIQNTSGAPVEVTMDYFLYGGGPVYSVSDTIPPGASHGYHQADIPELGSNFSGLVLVQAPMPVIAIAETSNSFDSKASAYNGIAEAVFDTTLLSPRQQKGSTSLSATQLTNVGTVDTSVGASWYAGDGAATWSKTDTVSPSGPMQYYLPALTGIPAGFDGSLVMEADQPLVALVNWTDSSVTGDGLATNPAIALSQLGGTLHLPRVAHSLSSAMVTEFSAQNPGMTAADVLITFYDQSGAETAVVPDTIPAKGVHRYATGDVGALGDEWEGSATIESTEPVAVEVLQVLLRSTSALTVTSPADSGPGTLRQALLDATSGDTITFDPAVFPPASPVSITLASALPTILVDSLTIDAGVAGVILDGSGLASGDGLHIGSNGCAIKGLQILHFPENGIEVNGAANNTIGGNNSTPRAGCSGDCNVISGNQENGVLISGSGATDNTVSGNYIGTDVHGTGPVSNGENGVAIDAGASDNLVGGNSEAERNLITYNYGDGVSVTGSGTNGNRVAGNWIGVDADSTDDVNVSLVAYSPAYASDGTVFLGTRNRGLFKSTDRGAHWSRVESELMEGRDITGLALSPAYATDHTLFVVAGGLLKSTDGGVTWQNVSPIPGSAPRSLALSPDYGNDQTVLAGYLMSWVQGQMVGGVFKSTDGGLNWVQLDFGIAAGQASAMAAAARMSACLSGDPALWWLDCAMRTEPPALVAEDRASSSTQVAGRTAAFSPDYAHDRTLFVGTWGTDGSFYKSLDAGATWTAMNAGLDGSNVSHIAISPDYGSDATLFVMSSGSGAHPYHSTDGGATWDILTAGLPADDSSAVALAISPGFATDNTLYVAYLLQDPNVGAFFRSVDRGGTWIETSPGLQHQHLVRSVAVSPNHAADDELLLAAGANGLLRSPDRGDTWLLAGGDLTDSGNAGSGVGLHAGAHGNIVGGSAVGEGNLISNNGYNGVTLDGAATSGNSVMGNYIGTDASGTDGLANAASGVRIRLGASENAIGGLHASMGGECSGVCNLISGNGEDGVLIEGSGTMSNTVSGNYIGTDRWGMDRIGNPSWGVFIDDYAAHNTVGGEAEGSGNLISGNDSMAVSIRNSSDNQVLGNLVGTDASGTAPLPNGGGLGVYFDAKRNLLEHNVVAGNGFYGVQIAGPDATDNVVRGNWIGTNTSDHELGNAWGGIEITSDAGYNTIGPDNVIKYNESPGVWIAGHDNLIVDSEIAHNGGSGVGVGGATSLRNTITVNSIYSNAGLGIELVDGGNTELPAPIVLDYDLVAGTASGTTCAGCVVEVFSDGGDEGRWYEGMVTANGAGEWSFSKGSSLTGPYLHATATDADGNTSEFSRPGRDLAVVGVAPSGEVPVGKPREVRAELFNGGSHPESNVPVRCTIAGTGYDEDQTSSEVLPATWAWVDFPAWTPAAAGVYTLTCQSMLPGDENPDNDSFSQVVTATVVGPPDVWTKDNADDTGDVPSGHPWWVSPDIWIRHQPDGGLVHQNPIALQENTVYVRLRNRGGRAASGVVQVFWDRSRIGWPCKVQEPNVGTIRFEGLAPGEVRIVSLAWTPQEVGHHGLHTVIEAGGDPADWSAPCSPHRPRWDNNVSWRNVIVYFQPPPGARQPLALEQAEVDLVNPYDWPADVDLIVERRTFPTTGTIKLRLAEDLFDRWQASGGQGAGIAVGLATKEITVTGEVSATIVALPMEAMEEATATLVFDAPDEGAFEVALYERIDGFTVGGVTYQWIVSDTVPPEVVATSPLTGAVDVALDAPIVITFTEEIGPLSFKLALEPDPEGWGVTWNGAGTVVTATHAPFVGEIVYTATVVTAKDAFANAMQIPYAWSFTARGGWWVYLPTVLRNH